MDEHTPAEDAFLSSIRRARGICHLQRYLARGHTDALDTDDLLRAAVVMTVSALDYLVHEIIRIEAVRCSRRRAPVARLELPLSIIYSDAQQIDELVSDYVRTKNAHKTFVDPGKLAEALSVYFAEPWVAIAKKCDKTPETAKLRLRAIYRWRNRIAHEADINPEYAGATLWEIRYEDVEAVIADIEHLGKGILEAIREFSPASPLQRPDAHIPLGP